MRENWLGNAAFRTMSLNCLCLILDRSVKVEFSGSKPFFCEEHFGLHYGCHPLVQVGLSSQIGS